MQPKERESKLYRSKFTYTQTPTCFSCFPCVLRPALVFMNNQLAFTYDIKNHLDISPFIRQRIINCLNNEPSVMFIQINGTTAYLYATVAIRVTVKLEDSYHGDDCVIMTSIPSGSLKSQLIDMNYCYLYHNAVYLLFIIHRWVEMNMLRCCIYISLKQGCKM